MLRKTFLSILSASALCIAGMTAQAATVTLTSGGTGVLQDAIDAATAGDTIILDTNGTFVGDVVVTKTLTIEAAPGKTPSIINDGSTAPAAGAKGAFDAGGSSYFGISFSEGADGSRVGSVSGGLIQIYLDADAGGTATAGTGTAAPHAVLGFEGLDAGSEITVENAFITITGERRAGRDDNFGDSPFHRTGLTEAGPASCDSLILNLTEVIFDANRFPHPYQNPLGAEDRGRTVAGIRTQDTTMTLNITRSRLYGSTWGALNLQRGNYDVNIVDSEIGDDSGLDIWAIGNAFLSGTNRSTATVNVDGSVLWGGIWGGVSVSGSSQNGASDPGARAYHEVNINDSLVIGNLTQRSDIVHAASSNPYAPVLGDAAGAINVLKAPAVYNIDHSDIVDITDFVTHGTSGEPIHAAAVKIQPDDVGTTWTRTVNITNSNLVSENWHVLAGDLPTTPPEIAAGHTLNIGWNNVFTGNTTATLYSSTWTTGTTLVGDPDLNEDPMYAGIRDLDAASGNANLSGTGDGGSDIGVNNTYTGQVPVELGVFTVN